MKIKGEATRLWTFLAIIVVALGAVLLLFAGDPRVAVRAVKKAERSDEVIIRLQETRGRAFLARPFRWGQGSRQRGRSTAPSSQ